MTIDSLPADFVSAIERDFGKTLAGEILEGLAREREHSVRLNRSKSTTTVPLADLRSDSVAWLPPSIEGFYLQKRPLFALDPLWHAGAYYVQDASSMIIAQLLGAHLDADRPYRVLDLCAAPGGKTTLLYDILPQGSTLVANEPISKRAQILNENLQKWCGTEGCMVASAMPQEWVKTGVQFDCILVDAPCSGEGLFRKDADAVEMWSPDNVSMCSARQREILQCADRMLNSQGILVYSTCTLNKQENEAQIEYLTHELGYEALTDSSTTLDASWGVVPSDNLQGWHFFPGRVRGEGLFVSILRKPATSQSTLGNARQKRNAKNAPSHYTQLKTNQIDPTIQAKIRPQETDRWIAWQKSWHIASADLLAILNACLEQHIHVLSCGIEAVTYKGSQQTLTWSLTMSQRLERTPQWEWALTREQALSYLRGETFDCSQLSDRANGWIVVTFDGVPLGAVNYLKNRFNNLYPKEYRLRMR